MRFPAGEKSSVLYIMQEERPREDSCTKENGEDRLRSPWFVMRDTCRVVNFPSFSHRRLTANFGFS